MSRARSHFPQLQRPEDQSGKAFEDMCLAIYGRYLKTTDARLYGRRGQRQKGVDIRASDKTERASLPYKSVLIQCKDYKKLTFAKIKKDLLDAMTAWDESRNNFSEYIIATTSASDAKLDDDIRNFEATHSLEFKVSLHCWEKLQEIVESDAELQCQFLERDFGRHIYSETMSRLSRSIELEIESGNLRTAKQLAREYLNSSPPQILAEGINQDLHSGLTGLYMKAYDFFSAYEFLDREIPRRPYDASLRIQYARVRRFMNQVQKPLTGLLPFFANKAKDRFETEIDDAAPILLSAIGSLDEQLTLAYLVIFHAGAPEWIDKGLERFLTLVLRAWPQCDVAPPDKPLEYFAYRDFILHQSGRPLPIVKRRNDTSNLFAVSLAAAYSKARELFAMRRPWSFSSEIEKSLGGWAQSISNIDGFEINRPIALEITERAHSQFPILWSEIQRNEWARASPIEYTRLFDRHFSSKTTLCTSDALIADCAREPRGIDHTNVEIITTNQSIERLLCILRKSELLVDPQTAPTPPVTAFHKALRNAVSKVKSITETIQDPEYSRILSVPLYIDGQAKGRPQDEITSIIALARLWNKPVLSTAAHEINRLTQENIVVAPMTPMGATLL
jgi:hypothetical protein